MANCDSEQSAQKTQSQRTSPLSREEAAKVELKKETLTRIRVTAYFLRYPVEIRHKILERVMTLPEAKTYSFSNDGSGRLSVVNSLLYGYHDLYLSSAAFEEDVPPPLWDSAPPNKALLRDLRPPITARLLELKNVIWDMSLLLNRWPRIWIVYGTCPEMKKKPFWDIDFTTADCVDDDGWVDVGHWVVAHGTNMIRERFELLWEVDLLLDHPVAPSGIFTEEYRAELNKIMDQEKANLSDADEF